MNDYLRANPSLFFVLFIFAFNCIRLVGLLLFFRDKRIQWQVRLFIGILVAYFALAAGPIANTRYFLPVSLIVMGCAVMGFDSVNKRKNIY